MTSLKAQVEASAAELRDVWTVLQGVTHSSLPQDCYGLWTRRAGLYRILDGTVGLLPARETAWDAAQAVASAPAVADSGRNVVRHGTLDMDFGVARHLAVTSYVAVTWSIYDRLANVCGRLAGIAAIAENPKQNPKACEHFLGQKDVLGFAVPMLIQQAYGWPMKVTYRIRNWLVHEGYEEGCIPFFSGDQIADGFRLHDDAAVHLEKCCGYRMDNGRITSSCIEAAEECWPTRELLTILAQYHAELDMMFAGLVKWSASSFVAQVTAFTARDKSALASAAAAGTATTPNP